MEVIARRRAHQRLCRSSEATVPEAPGGADRNDSMSVDGAVASAPAGATVNAENPWPGLLAFRETDQGYFQGRQTETGELFRLVMRERLTILFGLSGLGKSSLLQAGLFPLLRRENIFPVYIRLDFSSARPDLAEQVRAVIARE